MKNKLGEPLWLQVYGKKRAREYHHLMRLAGGKWYLDMLEAVVQVLSFLREDPAHILDLGAGTGRLSGRVLRSFPSTRIICIDGSTDMLEHARKNLRHFGPRAQFHCRNFGRLGWDADLPAMNAVISNAAIHHLTHASKRKLYAEIFKKLKPGGYFVNGDPIWPDSRKLKERNDLMWALYIQDRYKRLIGRDKTVPSILAWINKTRDAEGDKPASLEEQLCWLKQAGYAHVDCYWKTFGFAVFGGVRPA